jgi:hypothetical protein
MTSPLTALPALMMTVSVVSNVLAVHTAIPAETIQTAYPVLDHFSGFELFALIVSGVLTLAFPFAILAAMRAVRRARRPEPKPTFEIAR